MLPLEGRWSSPRVPGCRRSSGLAAERDGDATGREQRARDAGGQERPAKSIWPADRCGLIPARSGRQPARLVVVPGHGTTVSCPHRSGSDGGSGRWIRSSAPRSGHGIGGSREAVEPVRRERDSADHQGEAGRGEPLGHFLRLIPGPDPRAETLVDLLEVGGGRCLEGPGAGRLRDRGQRVGVRQDLDACAGSNSSWTVTMPAAVPSAIV